MPKELTEDEVQAFRDKLCEAFVKRFAEQGYGAVTMRGLAEDIGCSPMTPYRYFRDKDDILAAARAEGFRRLCNQLESAMCEGHRPLETVPALLQTYLNFASQEPDLYRLMYTDLQAVPSQHPELEGQVARARMLITSMAERFPQLASSDESSAAVAHAFWAALHGVISIHLHNAFGENTKFEEVVSFLSKVLIEGARVVLKIPEDEPGSSSQD